jgi:hypothetical protein
VILQNHREVRLEQLANLFPQKILFESRRKKLQRFLSLPNLTIEKIWWPLFSHWLTNNFDLSEILYIAIDRTQCNLKMALSAYEKRFGIKEMFRDYKSGGYNLESTCVTGNRLIALIILLSLAYTSAIMSGEKIKTKGVVKYVGRVKEKHRTQRRHSSFYLGIHGYAWLESLVLLSEQTFQLMSLSPHKRPYYQRGRQAEKLIWSTFEL